MTGPRITSWTEADQAPSGYRLAWLAADSDDSPCAASVLRVFTDPSREHLAELDVRVHPANRRTGIGSALLDRALSRGRELGRRTVIAEARDQTPGASFLAARGFRPALTLLYARLALDSVDLPEIRALVERPHDGYGLRAWTGAVPAELEESFAHARRAMDDMPTGDMDFGHVSWDVERVRAAAKAVAERGDVLHTVAAMVDGSIAGFTEVVVPGSGEGDAQNYGTGVLPEHRGHGLGRWMKAASILRVRDRHPRLAGMLTDVAEQNTPMLAIVEALGYRQTHVERKYRLDL
ncbi:GNAT family N-acetyltransferase [Fodinicola acaciae]|uniref:GNAT family N-acetyltransferase n=1 Tax=Fodinicola acaciae TaxID=2681555 RepID=UPI001C9E9D0C|nr:GNAT family N-acetyltransferase [Fodinicola acaciae]